MGKQFGDGNDFNYPVSGRAAVLHWTGLVSPNRISILLCVSFSAVVCPAIRNKVPRRIARPIHWGAVPRLDGRRIRPFPCVLLHFWPHGSVPLRDGRCLRPEKSEMVESSTKEPRAQYD